MKPRRYYQFVERDSDEVSVLWKLSHAFIFILTAIVSSVSAYAFADLFDIFNYKCVLYSEVAFKLVDMHYNLFENYNLSTTDISTVASTLLITNATAKIQNMKILDVDDGELQRGISDVSQGQEVEGRPGIFIFEDQLWTYDKDRWKVVYMWMTRSVFSSVITCDYVLFVPLLSIIVASTFATLTVVCGRGGRGYTSDTIKSSWIYVYPVIVASAVMTIMSFISSNIVSSGLLHFCEDFYEYTGEYKCSQMMDYFTVQQQLGRRNFYLDYILSYYSYSVGMFLWSIQLCLGCLRVATVVDFRFDQVLIRKRKKFQIRGGDDEHVEEVWDKIQTPKLYAVYQQLKKARNQ